MSRQSSREEEEQRHEVSPELLSPVRNTDETLSVSLKRI